MQAFISLRIKKNNLLLSIALITATSQMACSDLVHNRVQVGEKQQQVDGIAKKKVGQSSNHIQGVEQRDRLIRLPVLPDHLQKKIIWDILQGIGHKYRPKPILYVPRNHGCLGELAVVSKKWLKMIQNIVATQDVKLFFSAELPFKVLQSQANKSAQELHLPFTAFNAMSLKSILKEIPSLTSFTSILEQRGDSFEFLDEKPCTNQKILEQSNDNSHLDDTVTQLRYLHLTCLPKNKFVDITPALDNQIFEKLERLYFLDCFPDFSKIYTLLKSNRLPYLSKLKVTLNTDFNLPNNYWKLLIDLYRIKGISVLRPDLKVSKNYPDTWMRTQWKRNFVNLKLDEAFLTGLGYWVGLASRGIAPDRDPEELMAIKELTSLSLINNQLESLEGLFGDQSHLTELRYLELGKNPLGDAVAKTLTEAKKKGMLSKLASLKLDDIKLEDEGLIHFCEVGWGNLNCLELKDNLVTSLGIKMLIQKVMQGKFPQLSQVVFRSDGQTTQSLIKKLAELPTEKRLKQNLTIDILNYSPNQDERALIDQIMQTHPGLTIVSSASKICAIQ